MQPWTPVLITLVLLVMLYIATRMSISQVFRSLMGTFRHDGIVFVLFSIIFFPGTVVHEMAHYLTAIVLFLKVRSIHLIPERKGNEIKLGKVIYEKADPVRGILVGVAPVLFGIAFLLAYPAVVRFPNPSPWINVLSVYLFFVVSTTMFSSKQDLVDLAALLPFVIIGCLGFLYFKPDVVGYIKPLVSTYTVSYLWHMNSTLTAAVAIHVTVVLVLKLLTLLVSRSR